MPDGYNSNLILILILMHLKAMSTCERVKMVSNFLSKRVSRGRKELVHFFSRPVSCTTEAYTFCGLPLPCLLAM